MGRTIWSVNRSNLQVKYSAGILIHVTKFTIPDEHTLEVDRGEDFLDAASRLPSITADAKTGGYLKVCCNQSYITIAVQISR